jgi:hypothetical protein
LPAPSTNKLSYVTVYIYMLFLFEGQGSKLGGGGLLKEPKLFRIPGSSGCSNGLSLSLRSVKVASALPTLGIRIAFNSM